MKTTITTIAMLATLATAFTSCKKDKKTEPEAPAPPINQGELITTMKVTLTDTITNVSATYVFSDLDGAGGNAATFGNGGADSVINITANKAYFTKILLLDESKSPVDTISNEVEEEGIDHMFFFNGISPTGTTSYTTTLNGGTTIKYLDSDASNRGIGLLTLWTAPLTPMPKEPLLIELKHQPSVKNGSYGPGETDIQVAFKIKVN